MASVDKDVERLIVRRLDGELTEEEELTLNRELIRNPDARELLESYGGIDELAAVALHETIGTGDTRIDTAALPSRSAPQPHPSHRWLWQLATGSIAAAILAVFVARMSPVATLTGPTVAELGSGASTVQPIPMLPASRPGGSELMRNVGSTRPKSWRDTGREVFGVIGDDGNIYWIGVDRMRTARVRPSERM